MRTWLVLALLAACSGPKTHPPTQASCPAAFGDAVGTACSTTQICEYPAGVCSCTSGTYCGGAEPPPEVEAERQKQRWTCTPTPPAVRADGCPGRAPPVDKTACTTEGMSCRYGDCCSTDYRCTNGSWHAGEEQCPP